MAIITINKETKRKKKRNKETKSSNLKIKNKYIALFGLFIALVVPIISGIITYYITIRSNDFNFEVKKYEISNEKKNELFSSLIEKTSELNSNFQNLYNYVSLFHDFRKNNNWYVSEFLPLKDSAQKLINITKENLKEVERLKWKIYPYTQHRDSIDIYTNIMSGCAEELLDYFQTEYRIQGFTLDSTKSYQGRIGMYQQSISICLYDYYKYLTERLFFELFPYNKKLLSEQDTIKIDSTY